MSVQAPPSRASEGKISHGKAQPEQRDALLRLLHSDTFASAPRLRAVIEYLLLSIENGSTHEITEQSVGQSVFGRPAGYNASEDNIVRVTIRHLRTRLDEFYKNEGRNEPLALVIPKGKYQPTFVPRHAPAEPTGSTEDSGSLQESVQRRPVSDGIPATLVSSRPAWRRGWIGLICCFAMAAAFFLGYAWRNSVTATRVQQHGILSRICHKGTNVLVVVVDSNLQVYRSVFGRQISLDDYIHSSFGDPTAGSNDPRIAKVMHIALDHDDTNVSSAIVGAAILQALDQRHVLIKDPREISMREFQDQKSVVLLGGPWSNPWGQIFERRLNFRIFHLPDQPAYSGIHNESPRPGEPSDYMPHMDGNLSINYVRIAILPNFNHTGHIFLVGATSTESLEAGGHFLLDEDVVPDLLRRFHAKNADELPPVELVLEVRGLDSVPSSNRILAERTVIN